MNWVSSVLPYVSSNPATAIGAGAVVILSLPLAATATATVLGISAAGPVAGCLFATAQAAGLGGVVMASVQSVCMAGFAATNSDCCGSSHYSVGLCSRKMITSDCQGVFF